MELNYIYAVLIVHLLTVNHFLSIENAISKHLKFLNHEAQTDFGLYLKTLGRL